MPYILRFYLFLSIRYCRVINRVSDFITGQMSGYYSSYASGFTAAQMAAAAAAAAAQQSSQVSEIFNAHDNAMECTIMPMQNKLKGLAQ